MQEIEMNDSPVIDAAPLASPVRNAAGHAPKES
jgi:hypothetical protein